MLTHSAFPSLGSLQDKSLFREPHRTPGPSALSLTIRSMLTIYRYNLEIACLCLVSWATLGSSLGISAVFDLEKKQKK